MTVSTSLQSLMPHLHRMCAGHVPYHINPSIYYANQRVFDDFSSNKEFSDLLYGSMQHEIGQEFFPVHMTFKDCDHLLHDIRSLEDRCNLWQKASLNAKNICMRLIDPATFMYDAARKNITTVGECFHNQKKDVCEYAWSFWNMCLQGGA